MPASCVRNSNHAIAVLEGESPAEFTLTKTPFASAVPGIPAGVPSTLLQRRPDVAAAERQAAAASAQIGVAISAWFPSLDAGRQRQFLEQHTEQSADHSESRVVDRTFTGRHAVRRWRTQRAHRPGARRLRPERGAVPGRACSPLSQQVEDSVANLRILEKQAALDTELVRSAHEAETLTLNQYRSGTVPFSSVISAQTTTLSSEQTALTVLRSRLVGSVALISALGGGVDEAAAPKDH